MVKTVEIRCEDGVYVYSIDTEACKWCIIHPNGARDDSLATYSHTDIGDMIEDMNERIDSGEWWDITSHFNNIVKE
jgi:hypothetical protein